VNKASPTKTTSVRSAYDSESTDEEEEKETPPRAGAAGGPAAPRVPPPPYPPPRPPSRPPPPTPRHPTPCQVARRLAEASASKPRRAAGGPVGGSAWLTLEELASGAYGSWDATHGGPVDENTKVGQPRLPAHSRCGTFAHARVTGAAEPQHCRRSSG
jgi:hypothetical protein